MLPKSSLFCSYLGSFFFLKIKGVYFLNEERLEVNMKTASCMMFTLNIKETPNWGR